jgi:hypothetical protein
VTPTGLAFRVATQRPLLATRTRIAIGGLAALALAIAAPTAGIIIAIAGTRHPNHPTTTPAAGPDIPAEPLAAYHTAADTYHTDWAILAAIGWEECRHGTSQLPGCAPDTVNPAGARGYMQFLGTTWRTTLGQHALEPRTSPPAPDGHGFATDGNNDAQADPWSWPDAAHSAARYLTHLAIQHDPRGALYGYNHDLGYVARVLATAQRYQQETDAPSLTTVDGITLNTRIAPDIAALLNAARADGLTLSGSGYRSHDQQIQLRRQHCGTSHYATYQMPASQCTPPTARPGTSMHEQGLAIDFTCNRTLITTRTNPCYQWLTTHATAYGLHELSTGQEPWHFSTNGR